MEKPSLNQSELPAGSTDNQSSLGAKLWQAACEEKYIPIGAGVALLLINRNRVIRTGISLAADLIPLERTPNMVKAGSISEASFANLVQTMRTEGITTADLAASVKPIQRIGVGTNSEVFSIDKLPEYVLRKPLKTPVATDKELVEVTDIFPGTNVGQPIAVTGNLQVLQRQHGEALKFAPFLGQYERTWALRRQTRMLANLPQESFDDFAQTLKQLNDRQLFFDPHGGNVILDKNRLKLGPIDLLPRYKPEMINSKRLFDATFFANPEARVWPYTRRVKNMINLAARKAGLPD
jgi:hypothetical protein